MSSEPKGGSELVSTLYDDPYQYDLLAQMTAPADLPLYHRLVEESGDPVLELACGTGRVCLDLAHRGATITGVDRSRSMIEWAKKRAASMGLSIRLEHGDMRDFELRGELFALILVPYNAFNHLYSVEDVRRCLEAISRHMNEDSRLVIDTFNPDPLKLDVGGSAAKKILEYRDPVGEQFIRLLESTRYDAAAQINYISWSYEASGSVNCRRDELRMRIFFPQELEALLAFHGFEIERKLGDYDDGPFTSTSSKQIVICRRR